MIAKSVSIKASGCKSGGCVPKVVELTSGGLSCVARSKGLTVAIACAQWGAITVNDKGFCAGGARDGLRCRHEADLGPPYLWPRRRRRNGAQAILRSSVRSVVEGWGLSTKLSRCCGLSNINQRLQTEPARRL